MSIFVNSPVRAAYEKISHSQNTKKSPIPEKSINPGGRSNFLTELDQCVSAFPESVVTSALTEQKRRSDFEKTLDCVKELFDERSAQERFNYFVPLRSRDGYGNLYHVVRASNVETHAQDAYLTVSLFGVTQFLNGVPEYFDSVDRYKRELLCFDQLKRLRLFGNYRMMKTFGLWKQAFRHRCVTLNSKSLATKWRFESINLHVLLLELRKTYLQLESQMNFRLIPFNFPETMQTFFDKINAELIELIKGAEKKMQETGQAITQTLQDVMNYRLATLSQTDPFKHTAMHKIRRDEDIAHSCLKLCLEMICDFNVSISERLVTSILQCMGQDCGAQSEFSFQVHLKVDGVEASVPKMTHLDRYNNGTFKIKLIASSEEKFEFDPPESAFTEKYDKIVDCIFETVQNSNKFGDKKVELPLNGTRTSGGGTLGMTRFRSTATPKMGPRCHVGSRGPEFFKNKIKPLRALFLSKLFPSYQLLTLLSEEFDCHRIALNKFQEKLGCMSHQLELNPILHQQDLLLQGLSLMQKFRGLPDSTLCGQFLVDCVGAIGQLVERIPAYLDDIRYEMLTHFRETLKSTLDIAVEFNQHLAETTTTQQFMSQNDMILKFRTDRPEVMAKKQYTKTCHEVCQHHSLDINAVDSAMSLILEEEFEKMDFQIDIFEAEYEENFTKYGNTLEFHDHSIRDDIIALNLAIQDELFDKETEFTHVCVASIAELSTRYHEILVDIQTLIHEQRFFNHPESKFDGIVELGDLIQFKLMVWNVLAELIDATQEISSQLVEKVDFKYFEVLCQKFLGMISSQKLTSELFEGLQHRVKSFIDVLTIVRACQCPELKVEHWESIETILEIRIDRENASHSHPFIVQSLFVSSAHKFSKEVLEIAREAQSQNACKIKFEDIQEMWSNCDFVVVPYKDKYDMFCLGKTEAIQNLLESSMIDLAQLISSPYAKMIKSDALEMLAKLRGLNETFQLLLKLETEWLRLEPIFNVGDIQRSLPVEYKLYGSTDRFRKGFLKSVSQIHNVMRNLLGTGFAESLKKQFDTLDKVSAGLHSYIAAKRAAFPRFFFASDGDLLSVMAKYKQYTAVSEYVNLFFRGIGGVRIVNDVEVSITDMVSVRGEIVPLVKPVKLRGTPDNWLNDLEENMRKQVIFLTLDAVATYHDQSLDRWVETLPCQILLLSLNIIMTKAIESILSSHKQIKEKLSELTAHIEQRQSIAAILLNMRISDINRNKYELLIASYMHLSLVLDKLQQLNEQSTLHSFVWTSQLRAYFRAEDGKDQVMYRQLFANVLHDCEFLGNLRLFVLSPEMHRCAISIFNAVHNHINCELFGASGVGKTELVSYLSDTFGKICHVVQGFLPFQYSVLLNAVIGSAVCNGWLIVENSMSLGHEVLSVMASYIETLKNMVGSKDDHVMIDGQAIQTSGIFQVFPINLCNDESIESWKSVHKSFRNVHVLAPNWEDIYIVIFNSAGFRKDSHLLGRKWSTLCSVSKDRLPQACQNVFTLRVLKRILHIFQTTNDRNETFFWKRVSTFYRSVLEDSTYQEFCHLLCVISGIHIQDVVSVLSANTESEFIVTDASALQSSLLLDSRLVDMLANHCLDRPLLILGEAACGKSSLLTGLKKHMTKDDMLKGIKVDRVFETIFPNAIEQDDLMGNFDLKSKKHSDGIFTEILRRSCKVKNVITTVVFDGVPSVMWTDYLIGYIESNNSVVISGNEVLHFSQGKPRLIIETDQVMNAAPSFLHRLCTCFVQKDDLISSDFLSKELAEGFNCELEPKHVDFANSQLFSKPFLADCIEFVTKQFSGGKNLSQRLMVSACIKLFTGLIRDKYVFITSQKLNLQDFMMKAFVLAIIWTVGGTLLVDEKLKFSEFFRASYGRFDLPRFPNSATVYDYFIHPNTLSFCHCKDYSWCGQPEHFVAPVCIARILLETQKASVVFLGPKHSGKSSLINCLQLRNGQLLNSNDVQLAFNRHTMATDIRCIIDSNIPRISKGVVGSANGAPTSILIDDMNAYQHECVMNSATECIRQILDGADLLRLRGTFLDLAKKTCTIANVQVIASCNIHLNQKPNSRLLRHFFRIYLKPICIDNMKQIFSHFIQNNEFQPQMMSFLMNSLNILYECFRSITAQFLTNTNMFWSAPTVHDCSRIMNSIVHDVNSDGLLEENWTDVFMYNVSTVFLGMATTIKSKDQIKSTLSLFFKNEYPTHPNTDQELHCIILDHGFDPKPSHITCFEALRTKVEDEVSQLNAANSVSLKMTLSDDLLRQIATFSKALSRNKSHLLVSSPSGYHRYCTFRLISSMMRHTFWEFDAKLQSRDVLNEIIGRIYLTVGGEQDKALMVVKIDLLKPWNSDVCAMLSDLHCLISTGDPGNTVSAEERRKVMEIAAHNTTSARSSGMEHSEVLHVIRTRLLSNFHLVFVTNACENQMQDCMIGFPAFIEKMTVFTRGSSIESQEQNEIIATVIDSLCRNSNLDKSERIQIVTLLGSLHTNATCSDGRFSRSNLISCAKLICCEVLKYRIDQDRQRLSWKTSLTRVQEITDHLKELEIKSLELESEAKMMNQDNENLSKMLETAKSSLASVRESLERLLSERKSKNADLQKVREHIRILLEPSQQDSQSALKTLQMISKSSVNEFVITENPEQCLQLLGILISLLFGEAPDWKSLRKINSNEGLQVKLFNYETSSIPPRLGRQILKIIEVSKIDEKAIEKVSNVGKVLALWLLACVASLRVTVEYSKDIAERDDLASLVQGLGSQIESQKPNLEFHKAQVEELQKKFDISTSNAQSLQECAGHCTTSIMRCSKLLEAFESSVPDWTSKLEEQMEMETSHVTDLVLACFFVSYMGVLDSRARQQLMTKSFEICKDEKMCYNQGNVNKCLVASKIVYNEWIVCGLPTNAFSLENGLSIRSSFAWPLIYDPHDIATQWIKRMEQRNNLRVFSCLDAKSSLASIETAVVEGWSILLENLPVNPPSWLVSLLSRKSSKQNAAAEHISIEGRSIVVGAGFRLYATSKHPLQELSPFYFGEMTQVNFDVNLETAVAVCSRMLASWCMHQSSAYVDVADVGFVQSVKQLLDIDEKRKNMLMAPMTTMIQDDSYFTAALQSSLNLSVILSKLNEAQIVVDVVEHAKKKCNLISHALAKIFVLSQNFKLTDERFYVSFEWFQNLVSTLTKQVEFDHETSGEELFQSFAAIFFQRIAEMVPTGLFKIFILDCAIAICESEGMEPHSDSIKIIPKLHNYHISKTSLSFFINRRKTPIPSERNHSDHPFLSAQQMEALYAMDKCVPSLTGIFQCVQEHHNLWRDWFENGRFAIQKSRPLASNTEPSSCFDSLVILCCLFPSREEVYIEEFCNSIFTTKSFVHGWNCLPLKDSSNFTNISYLLVDGEYHMNWMECIVEHFQFLGLVARDNLKHVEYSIQNESQVERRLSHIIKAHQNVVIENVHEKFSWLQMILAKLRKELDGGFVSQVFVVLPWNQTGLHSAPYYGMSRKVYCKAKLDFFDNVKLNAETLLNFQSKFIKPFLKKAIVCFHSVLCHEELFSGMCHEIRSCTLKDCLVTMESVCESTADLPITEEVKKESVLWCITAHYGGFARDELQLKQFLQVFSQCLKTEKSSKNPVRVEKLDVLDVDSFAKSLPILSILEFCGYRERKDTQRPIDEVPRNLTLSASLADNKMTILTQIHNMVPTEIYLENQKNIDWFLREEIRIFNAAVACIFGVLEDCLQCRVHSNFQTMQYSIFCIINDKVPSTFPHPHRSSSLRSLLSCMTRRRDCFQSWLERGPPMCHDVSLYSDIRSFLAYLYMRSSQTSHEVHKFSLKVSRFEHAKDISATEVQGVFVHGLMACRCRWDAKRRRFCSLAPNDEDCTNLPVCLLSLDQCDHDAHADRRSLPLYHFPCDGSQNWKEPALASFSVGILEGNMEMIVASSACLAFKHNV